VADLDDAVPWIDAKVSRHADRPPLDHDGVELWIARALRFGEVFLQSFEIVEGPAEEIRPSFPGSIFRLGFPKITGMARRS
jgi:hypothetical protein